MIVKFSIMKCFAGVAFALQGLMTFLVQTLTASAIEVPLLTIAERKG